MQDKNSFNLLKEKLEERNRGLKENLVTKHKDAFDWLHNTKQIAAGAMSSILLLTSPATHLLAPPNDGIVNQQFVDVPENLFVVADMKPYLPATVGELLPAQENKIADVLSNYYGMSVKPEINGLRLNNTYGYIGLEQHLKRYPGDSIESHFEDDGNAASFAKGGMAPGLGAFGYFAKSQQDMTQEEIEREKYYIAVQTFRAKDYVGRLSEYRDFFKFRKMLVVNPNTGRAIVVVIGDAGPAVWTGKQLGGSPEVMKHLERVDGAARGPVLYFFIEDPDNKIPLGPIDPVETI